MGKTSTTTQSVSIPPEVMARYNAVNASAEKVAATPFQQYSTDPSAFVAQLNANQLAGIDQTSAYSQYAQPYYQQASGQLMGAQEAGQQGTQAAYQPLMQGYAQGQAYGQAAGQGYLNAPGAAQPYFGAAQQGLGAGLEYAQGLQSGALGAYGQAAGAAAPLQGYGAGAITGAVGAAQPSQQYGLSQIMGASGAAAPMQSYGGQAITGALGAAAPLQAYGAGMVTQSPQAAAAANQAAMQMGLGAAGLSMPLYQQAIQGTQAGLAAGQPFLNAAQGQIGGATQGARPLLQEAATGTQEALLAASPYFQQATQNLGAGSAAASPYFQTATEGTQNALAAGQPFQSMAQQAALAGSRGVSPEQFSGEAVQKYMSPYMSNVIEQTMKAQAQQNAQQRQALTGDAIRAGAFGGDRAGIAQANLAYQQNLANSQTIANLLQGGYGQALGAFQQQQGVNLGAEQANRAAQQNLANQALQIGQQGYGQQMGAAQQMANLGQTQFQKGLAESQQRAALGQGLYGQKLGAAQQMAGLGQTMFGQDVTAGQAMAGLGQQAYGQQVGAAQQLAGLGQGLNAQQLANAQTLSQLGQTQFGQQLGAGTAAGQLAQQAFNQQIGAGTAAAQLGQQLYGQNLSTGQAAAQIGQQMYGQQLGAGQAAAQLGQQLYGQNLAGAQFLQGMGAQGFQQQAAAAAQQAGLGQAQAALQFQQAQGLQGLGAQQAQLGAQNAAQQAALAQQQYGMGAGTAQALAGLGAGAQAAGLQGAQAQMQAGTIAQQTEQAGKQALYNQFLQQQSYPFQVQQFLANIAMGTGALSGSTTTTTAPSGWSDRRLKEDIRKIGETDDGLPIYKFRFKGEDKDQTHIGYMADEVEKKHPDAVGKKDGYKYVDYAKVNSRESMGGAVHDGGLGRAAFAYGGAQHVDPNDLQAIIQQQRQMYGPAMGGLYGGSAADAPRGGKSVVPAAGLHVPKLVTASGSARQQQSGVKQALGQAEDIQRYASQVMGKYNPQSRQYEGGLVEQAKGLFNKATDGFGKSAPSGPVDPLTRMPLEDIPMSARGGVIPRHHYKFGGGDIYKPEKEYFPEEVLDKEDKTPELATAKGGGGGGGKSGPSPVGLGLKAAGTLANFIPGVGPFIGAGLNFASGLFNEGGVVPRQHFKGGGFDDALNRTLQFEGGYANDTGGPTMMGISSKANPDVDLQRVKEDPEYRANIYKTRYWDPINAESMDPKMQRIAFDTAVNLGVGRTSELLKQADGDPAKLLALRQQHYNDLVSRDPETYGQYAKGWSNRVNALASEAELPSVGGLDQGRKMAAAQTGPSYGSQAAEGLGKAASGLGDLWSSVSKYAAPIGTGILTAASSKSPHARVAIMQGLGAGLAAMQPSEVTEELKKGQQIKNVGAALDLAPKAFYKDQYGNVRVTTRDGRSMSYSDWLDAGEPETAAGSIGASEAHKFALQNGDPRAVQRAEKMGVAQPAGAPGVPGVPGVGTPPGTQPAIAAPAQPPKVEPGAPMSLGLSPQAQQAANDELNRLRRMPEAQRDAEVITNKKIQQQAINNREVAYNLTPELNNLALPLVGMAAGEKITPGIFAPVLANAARGIDYVIKQAGLPDDYLTGGKAVNQYELAKKAEVALSAAKASGADMKAIRSLEEFSKAIANPSQDAATARNILAKTVLEKQKALEEAVFTQKYATSNKQFVVGQNASAAFREQMPDEMYLKQEAAIKDLMTKKLKDKDGTPWLSYLLNQGPDKELQKQNWAKLVNEHYGFDIARYFLNTVK